MRNSVGKGGQNSLLLFSGGTGTGWLQGYSDPKSTRRAGAAVLVLVFTVLGNVQVPCRRCRCSPCPLRAGPGEPRLPRRSRCAPRSTQEIQAAPRKPPPRLPAGIDPAWNPPGVSVAEGCTAGNCNSVALLEFVCFVILFILPS